ncbi:AraC family transcriptional regulator [Kinneretia aquatilis]|uniref:AraC family transcriptional regulator n=1 Tax=Kinneretia aquatilis TaxID=2070761 RepID=UPI001CBD81DC|nr:GyrI-like domain-containing protein [Paucibacter aquatile]WIV97096.1 GyrI-like domain-containing protein [Paucibacter aquatile]
MPSDSSAAHRLRHAQRMNALLDHIDRHLDQTLDLSSLAERMHFSPFHFHRVFAAWMGETLGDYLRRRRLDVAALMLAQPEPRSVLEVALAVGFGSSEAFARAFKLRFGQTPTAWRQDSPQRWARDLASSREQQTRRHRPPAALQSNLDQWERNLDQADTAHAEDDAGSSCFTSESTMQVRLQQLPASRVAYLRHIGPYGLGVHQFWMNTVLPWQQAQGLIGRTCYGIGHDDPHVTKADKCRYDACVEVDADFVPRSPASIQNLPGGRYAVAQFRGTLADFSHAWTELLRAWLPGSGLQIDGRPVFERYPPGAEYDPSTGVFSCELCLPVKAA